MVELVPESKKNLNRLLQITLQIRKLQMYSIMELRSDTSKIV